MGGLSVAGSEQLGGMARFMRRPHVATLMFIWCGRRKFFPLCFGKIFFCRCSFGFREIVGFRNRT